MILNGLDQDYAKLKLSMGNQELLKIDSIGSKFHFYGKFGFIKSSWETWEMIWSGLGIWVEGSLNSIAFQEFSWWESGPPFDWINQLHCFSRIFMMGIRPSIWSDQSTPLFSSIFMTGITPSIWSSVVIVKPLPGIIGVYIVGVDVRWFIFLKAKTKEGDITWNSIPEDNCSFG